MKNAIDEVVEKAPPINQRALKHKLERLAKRARPGNMVARELDLEWGLDMDYTVHDHGNQI